MPYDATRDAAVVRLLGSYEHEIAGWIADAVASRPPVFVDLGTSDGYYAVGVKHASSSTEVHGFEISKLARHECADLAARAGVTVNLHGRATPEEIAALLRLGAFVLSDVEGFEEEVFAPPLLAALDRLTVVVELHDGMRPGVTDTIIRRLSGTHTVEIVEQEPPRTDAPELAALTAEQRELMTRDMREQGGTRWGRFTPR